jgi:multidrug resistance efflux pump
MVDIPRPPVRRGRRRLIYGVTAALALVAATTGLRRVRPGAPIVERRTVWMGTVERGPLVREVLGPGTLVPEQIHWIAAKVSAHVERIRVRPGARVTSETVLLELANSDLELQALEAERELAQSEAELTSLQASLSAQRLAQESVVATLGSELADARRRARADEELAKRGFLSELEQGQTRGRATELEGRLEFEKKRSSVQARGIQAQTAAQRAHVERLRSIAEFRRRELDGLQIRAGVDGVLQELPLQEGQAVAAGGLLAKVVRPERLKAELLIPEIQAKDVQVGQRAVIDIRHGVIEGHVTRMDPAAQAGSVRVDVSFDAELPAGARPDLNVDGTIELERLPNVLFVDRPASASGQPGSTVSLFKLDADGEGAERTLVRLGRSSVKNVEILTGLGEGDRVILSDASQWGDADRIRLQ